MRCLNITYLLALLAVPVGACFNPDLSQITFLCDPSQPECPDGQSCVDNRCVPPLADLSPIDGGDLGSISPFGCADGSRNAVGMAYACAGGFAAGKARQLCASGWHVCTKSTGIDKTTCGMLSGFFVAEVPAYYQGNPGNESCGTGGNNPLWYGCGSRPMGVRMGVRGCQGFVDLLDCRGTGVTCTSGNQSLDTTADSSSADGVLCCQ